MNPNMLPFRSFFPSSTNAFFFITIFFFFFLVLQTALSADPQYEACVSHTCGLQNIRYPFWINNTQESYCGYPEFNITCSNQRPSIQNLGFDYYIRNISYEDYSIFVSSTTPRFSNPSCPHPLKNLPEELTPYHLSYETNLALNFYLNCTEPFPNTGTYYNISCLPNNNTQYSFIYVGYPLLESRNCESHFIKPVVRNEEGFVIESLVRGNYGAVMELDFVLEWIPRDDNCSICQLSGGHCGFVRSLDTDASGFLCFCPDSPYSRYCPESDNNEKLKPTAIGDKSKKLKSTAIDSLEGKLG